MDTNTVLIKVTLREDETPHTKDMICERAKVIFQKYIDKKILNIRWSEIHDGEYCLIEIRYLV